MIIIALFITLYFIILYYNRTRIIHNTDTNKKTYMNPNLKTNTNSNSIPNTWLEWNPTTVPI